MFFEPTSQIVGMPNVEFACLEASKDIDVIQKFALLNSPKFIETDFVANHFNFLQEPNSTQMKQRLNLRPSLRDALAKLSYSPENPVTEFSTLAYGLQAAVN
jgi:hypothetical protein